MKPQPLRYEVGILPSRFLFYGTAESGKLVPTLKIEPVYSPDKIYAPARYNNAQFQNMSLHGDEHLKSYLQLTLNIPSLGRQRRLPSWGPRRTPCFFVISQLFDAVDYSNYVFWVSETII